MRDRQALRQILIGAGAIVVPTLLVYLLVLLWPQDPPRAKFLGLEPTGHIGVGR